MDIQLATQPNEKRCSRMIETHILSLPRCCPYSGNPQPTSELEIIYQPDCLILEVASLRAYVDNYQGGRGAIRSMEGMIQQIAQDAADTTGVKVTAKATLLIEPSQKMILECDAWAKK